ncbi:hypothetical protein [Agrobacterium rosae]|uniref:hypothetical protein n=1 Tax=Agrobacterium rosae TaxID=1972867 RepID=UPI003BA2327E
MKREKQCERRCVHRPGLFEGRAGEIAGFRALFHAFPQAIPLFVKYIACDWPSESLPNRKQHGAMPQTLFAWQEKDGS